MEETRIKGINFFQSTDVRSVKDALSVRDVSEVQRQVQTLILDLGSLVDTLSGSALFLKNGKLSTGHVEFAAFRVQTLSLIFEYARDFMRASGEQDQYNFFLGTLGHEVGFTYGRQLLNNLRLSQCIPLDDFALIELWALFENDTGAGFTTVNKLNPHTLEISLANNPIGFYYTDEQTHSHCHFYSEYYRAILNEFLTSRPRLARDFMPELKPSYSKVTTVTERPRPGRCVFECEIHDETLKHAFDLLHVALTNLDDGKYGDAVGSGREALVNAQQEKLFPGRTNIPKNFFKAFQSLMPKRDFKLMDETYQRASSVVHKTKERGIKDMAEIVRHIRYCVHEIERLDIDETRMDKVRKDYLPNA